MAEPDFVGDLPLADNLPYDPSFGNLQPTYNASWFSPDLEAGETPFTLGGTPLDTTMPGDPSSAKPGFFSSLNGSQIAALLAGLGPTALGAAGIIQSLTGGDKQTTQNVTRQVPAMGAQELAALTSSLGLLGDAQGVLSRRAGSEAALYDQAVNAYGQAGSSLAGLSGAISPLLAGLPQMAQAQQRALRGFSEQGDFADAMAFAQRASPGSFDSNPGPGDWARVPEAIKQQALAAAAGTQRASRDAVAALTPQAMGQVPGLLDAQRAMVDPAAQYRTDPAVMAALNAQALGAAQGNLPALNDTLRGQIGRIYEGRLQDVNRYVDEGLRSALDRARGMGFAGGMEVFREGAPGALVDRTMAEAVRQRGTLAGQQAEQELALAQALPLLGSRLATEQANIGFSGNAQNRALADTLGGLVNQRLSIPQLAASLEAQRIGSRAQEAGAYTTPMSVALQGGSNLVNLNQQLAASLGTFANQGMNQRANLIGAATGVGNSLQQGRLAGAGSTSTIAQPFSLLDAFAPTAQLLGGVGGLLRGLNTTQNAMDTP